MNSFLAPYFFGGLLLGGILTLKMINYKNENVDKTLGGLKNGEIIR